MSSKVQKIKQEIERRIDVCEKYSQLHLTESTRIGNHAQLLELREIKDFIDSLPEEPASEDLEEEMIRWHKEHFGNKRDWEKTSGEYLTRKSQLDIARHFAEWQKQQMMKGAVYGYVSLCHDYPHRRSLVAIADGLVNFEYAERVKIIIIKTK